MTIKPTVHVTDSDGIYFLFFLCCCCSFVKNCWVFFFPFFLFVEHIQCEMVCDALDGALLFFKCVFLLLHSGGCVARTLECWSRSCPSEMAGMVKLRESEWDKRPCCLRLIVFPSQWQPEHRISNTISARRWSIRFGSVSWCVYAGTVILGHASPGSAGSGHWTESSSGGQPESRPSWPVRCEEDEITRSWKYCLYSVYEMNCVRDTYVHAILWEQIKLKHRLSVPDADVEDGLQADVSSTGKVLFILAHLDGLQPLIHWVHTELRGGQLFPAVIQSTHTF